MAIGIGHADATLSEAEVAGILEAGLMLECAGRRVLVIIPDATRTAPVPLFFGLLCKLLEGHVTALDFLVALGTHPVMSDQALLRLVGISPEERRTRYAHIGLHNHRWNDPQALITLRTIDADEMATLSDGHVRQSLPVTINRMVLDYDVLLVCGPVYPHEVVGFSGGNKYFFPGISGSEVIDLTHWVGAMLTSYAIIGTFNTPVRAIIDRAAQLIPRERLCAAMVVREEKLAGLYVGTPEAAWSEAAALSACLHITWVDEPYRAALAVIPPMYDDLWTGAKGMYKLEPVMEDGGELILYAPHISELSYVHGQILDKIGYHGCAYFQEQWDRFKDFPWAVLAHASHVRGQATYRHGVETPRITLTLASQVSRERCERMGLRYRSLTTIDLDAWRSRTSDRVLFVEKAGERLFKLKRDAPPGLFAQGP